MVPGANLSVSLASFYLVSVYIVKMTLSHLPLKSSEMALPVPVQTETKMTLSHSLESKKVEKAVPVQTETKTTLSHSLEQKKVEKAVPVQTEMRRLSYLLE